MPVNESAYLALKKDLDARGVTLVAVSKTKPVEDIMRLYELGQRDFGENYVQEMVSKATALPEDIRWHFIGHLQTNKVKLIAPFVQLVHGVDSLRLLKELDRAAGKSGRIIDCLLQVHIAMEETKFGLDERELEEVYSAGTALSHVRIRGLMGMASLSGNPEQERREFARLKSLLGTLPIAEPVLSMGMSGDYDVAIGQGSNMVRIGSLLFGERTKAH